MPIQGLVKTRDSLVPRFDRLEGAHIALALLAGTYSLETPSIGASLVFSVPGKVSQMRFGVVDENDLSSEQRNVFDEIASGPRSIVPRPFKIMLEVPEIARTVSALGTVLRYETSISDRLRELAILVVATECHSGMEWDGHLPIAVRHGATLDDLRIARGDMEAPADSEVGFFLDRARELARTTTVEDPDGMIQRVGKRATCELVGLVGYYRLVAMYVKMGGIDYPLPDVAMPE